MYRNRHGTGRHAAFIALALLAITLDFLQPLAHAMLLRDGGGIVSALAQSMCLPGGQDDRDSTPQAGELHECCLGLAHAPTFPAPTASFAVVEPVIVATCCPPVALDALTPVGTRDGPSQPHGPPSIS